MDNGNSHAYIYPAIGPYVGFLQEEKRKDRKRRQLNKNLRTGSHFVAWQDKKQYVHMYVVHTYIHMYGVFTCP